MRSRQMKSQRCPLTMLRHPWTMAFADKFSKQPALPTNTKEVRKFKSVERAKIAEHLAEVNIDLALVDNVKKNWTHLQHPGTT